MSLFAMCILFVAMITFSSIWCGSVIKRVADKKIRNCFAAISLCVSALSLVNLLKWTSDSASAQNALAVIYFIPAALIAVCVLIAAVIIGKKCRGTHPPIIPVTIIVIILVYTVLYAMNVASIGSSPVTIINGLLVLLLCESCIHSRFVKTGAGFKKLFEASSLSIVITDNSARVLYKTKAPTPDNATIKNVIKSNAGYKPNEDFIVTAKPLGGGFVVITDEIKELNMLLDELNETSLQLQKSNELIAREGEIRFELTNAKILNRLYEESVDVCVRKLSRVSTIISSLPEDDQTTRSNRLTRAKLLTSYVKNKFDMLSSVEPSGAINAQRLVDSICEATQIVKNLINCTFEIKLTSDIDSRIAMLAYDWVESICEFAALFNNASIKIEILENDGNIFIGMKLDGLDAHKKFEMDKQLVSKTEKYKGKVMVDLLSYSAAIKIKLPVEVL